MRLEAYYEEKKRSMSPSDLGMWLGAIIAGIFFLAILLYAMYIVLE